MLCGLALETSIEHGGIDPSISVTSWHEGQHVVP